jgi:protein gp37
VAESSAIEWTDATWNPVTGCSVISPGCTNCYAMRLAGTRMRAQPTRAGLTTMTKAGPVWTGEVRFNEHWLPQPLEWGRPRRIFVCGHGDLFHEAAPDDVIDRVFAVMALRPDHTFQVLTKRSARMLAYMTDPGRQMAIVRAIEAVTPPAGKTQWKPWVHRRRIDMAVERVMLAWPLRHIWMGVSAEDQPRADERVMDLLTPAAIRWLSAEPLLGPMDVAWALSRNPIEIAAGFLARARFSPGMETLRGLDLVVVGGESGPGARPMHSWDRSLRDQCAAARRLSSSSSGATGRRSARSATPTSSTSRRRFDIPRPRAAAKSTTTSCRSTAHVAATTRAPSTPARSR